MIEEGAILGPNVVIGPDCIVKKGILYMYFIGARVKNSVILKKSVIGENSWISDTILGWSSTVGRWVRIEGVTVCGENV